MQKKIPRIPPSPTCWATAYKEKPGKGGFSWDSLARPLGQVVFQCTRSLAHPRPKPSTATKYQPQVCKPKVHRGDTQAVQGPGQESLPCSTSSAHET